jgi:hypothetical protein
MAPPPTASLASKRSLFRTTVPSPLPNVLPRINPEMPQPHCVFEYLLGMAQALLNRGHSPSETHA